MLTFLRNLFRKGPSQDHFKNDLKHLITDVHSHLVPGVDDGASDMSSALALISRLHQLGFERLVTTPHIMSDLYPNTPDILQPRFNELKVEVAKRLPSLKLILAAEYFLDTSFIALLENPDELLTFPCTDPLNGEKHEMLLFEFAFHEAPNDELLTEAIFKMQTSGITPVVAHCARYPYWHIDRSKLEDLHDKGVILTVNAATLVGNYGDLAKETANHAVDQGWIRMVCSDTHAPHHIVAVKELENAEILTKLIKSGELLNPGVGLR
ncbi:MAG: hypothetical protein CL831_02495 [Crocinitomicaceae bacterium]|nr:hypothetical protein [Crocinitomicaceae bacterium]